MAAEYDESKSPEENLARAVYALADAVRGVGEYEEIFREGAINHLARQIKDGVPGSRRRSPCGETRSMTGRRR